MRDLLVGDVLRASAARLPNAVAASLEGEMLTYAELERRTQDLVPALLAAGVERGDRVVWQSETTLDAIPLYFATARIGAMFVPINPRYTSEESARIIAHADPVLTLGDAASGHDRLDRILGRPAGGAPMPTPREDDPHVIFYTSGTTGEPKGCMLSQRTQRLRAGNKSPYPIGGELCMFPQFHMSGWTRVLERWVESVEVTYVRRPDAEELMDAIERRRPSTTYCIPAVIQRILDSDRGGYDLSSLRSIDSGTSAVTMELMDGLARAFPEVETTLCYGSTEGGLVALSSPVEARRKPSAVGRPTPGTLLELDDTGELMVNSTHLFTGYFRNEAATERALAGGWFHTGDLAECDEDGLYTIIGRANDIIRTGGEAVAPVEVEAVLRDCPGVSEVAIVGVPDPSWGEVITAFVVTRVGADIELDTLRRHCRNRLAAHKHPRRLVLVDALPRTGATGQVQRRLLLKSVTVEAVIS